MIVGTVEQYRTKSAAQKACELLRTNINRETFTPQTVAELVTHYREKELPNKTPYTGEVYGGYLKTWILPQWGKLSLSDVRTVVVETWLGTLPLANGTRAKIRNVMSALFAHAMRWEFTNRNPITLVRQSAKRERTPDVLTVAELKALLLELTEPWKTAVFLAVTTGLRVSELLALKWSDCDFTAGEIHLTRGVVRQHIGTMKTEASRKPIPMAEGLADVLTEWRVQCAYNQPEDYIFASPQMDGKQPMWPTAGMEDHVRPAVKRAGISKRVGWHTLRHTFGTLLNGEGVNTKVIQELMRHANVSVTMDRYVQAVTPAKRAAQSGIVGLLDPCGPTTLTATAVNG
ncbi:MAG: site-specific integrase [Terriglobales bacterium]